FPSISVLGIHYIASLRKIFEYYSPLKLHPLPAGRPWQQNCLNRLVKLTLRPFGQGLRPTVHQGFRYSLFWLPTIPWWFPSSEFLNAQAWEIRGWQRAFSSARKLLQNYPLRSFQIQHPALSNLPRPCNLHLREL